MNALTVKQVAQFLAVNERTVYRMANAGELPAFKVAGSWRFLHEDLVCWIDERKRMARGSVSDPLNHDAARNTGK